MNIGRKEVVRMVTSITSIRCLCYKPERIIIFLTYGCYLGGSIGGSTSIRDQVRGSTYEGF